ncbi:hypothetical protein QJS10_CPB20g00480 [Acorus calamus]|uniref:Neprosin PEP catalytic domain-containing protein n=1 Tax=Acorus calamus TaxID=4465 RepID=A0AAV9CAD3_ACOCL|nr:hypothetical protein QJS10_CPB20g00480 [Acorus calamus]
MKEIDRMLKVLNKPAIKTIKRNQWWSHHRTKVYPDMYGDNQTQSFIYWTGGAYRTTDCDNLKCSGIVQVGSSLVPRFAGGEEVVQYGVEIVDSGVAHGIEGPHTTTEMGSSHFSGEGEGKATPSASYRICHILC